MFVLNFLLLCQMINFSRVKKASPLFIKDSESFTHEQRAALYDAKSVVISVMMFPLKQHSDCIVFAKIPFVMNRMSWFYRGIIYETAHDLLHPVVLRVPLFWRRSLCCFPLLQSWWVFKPVLPVKRTKVLRTKRQTRRRDPPSLLVFYSFLTGYSSSYFLVSQDRVAVSSIPLFAFIVAQRSLCRSFILRRSMKEAGIMPSKWWRMRGKGVYTRIPFFPAFQSILKVYSEGLLHNKRKQLA